MLCGPHHGSSTAERGSPPTATPSAGGCRGPHGRGKGGYRPPPYSTIHLARMVTDYNRSYTRRHGQIDTPRCDVLFIFFHIIITYFGCFVISGKQEILTDTEQITRYSSFSTSTICNVF